MNIEDFKQELLNKTLSEDLIIFVNSENTFLANSYIDEICAQRNVSKVNVNSLAETLDSAIALVMNTNFDLSILKVDIFDEVAEDYSNYKNCIVLCNKVAPEIKEAVQDYIINIPKLADWQVKDYMHVLCPGLSDKARDWLYEACCQDIYKIDNELKTLSIMDHAEQEETLLTLKAGETSDLFIKKSVFSLVDALIAGNTTVALDFLNHADYYSMPYISSDGKKERDIDPIGLTTLLLTKYKNILFVNFKTTLTKELLGLKDGAIQYLKREASQVSLIQIMKAIEFLSSIDSRLKANPSSLDFIDCRPSALLEYVVLGALACCRN